MLEQVYPMTQADLEMLSIFCDAPMTRSSILNFDELSQLTPPFHMHDMFYNVNLYNLRLAYPVPDIVPRRHSVLRHVLVSSRLGVFFPPPQSPVLSGNLIFVEVIRSLYLSATPKRTIRSTNINPSISSS